jgi:hypothetical protein
MFSGTNEMLLRMAMAHSLTFGVLPGKEPQNQLEENSRL